MIVTPNEKGQTLVIIFVLMVISLSIGIASSARFISTLSGITQSDQGSRALGVAEAAIERILQLPVSTLDDYIVNDNCTSDCYLEITAADGSSLVANVALSRLGESSEPFVLELNQTATTQVNLVGYPQGQDITICWDSSLMSVSGLYIYGTQGSYQADSFAYNPGGSPNSENGFDIATASGGYNNCFTIVAQADSNMLRLKSLYDDNLAVVIPASGQTIPQQGILIESTGTAGRAVKKVSVIISDPYLPILFDYALYQKSASVPLSN